MTWTKEYRAAYMREYREKHREWLRTTQSLWYGKYSEDICRRRRKRYHNDAAYRERILAQQRAYRKAKKESRTK